MLFAVSLLGAVLFAAPVPRIDPIPLPDIITVVAYDATHVALVHSTSSATIVRPQAIVTMSTMGAFGFPRVYVADGEMWGTVTGVLAGPPHKLTTRYNSTEGEHLIETPCGGYTSTEDCAKAHRSAVAAMKKFFPAI